LWLVLAISCVVLADIAVLLDWTAVDVGLLSYVIGGYYPVFWGLILVGGILAVPSGSSSSLRTAGAVGIAILHCLGCGVLAWLDDGTFFGGAMLQVVACYVWSLVAVVHVVAGLLRAEKRGGGENGCAPGNLGKGDVNELSR